jgi:L-amino acid N-acyltransferase YncA
MSDPHPSASPSAALNVRDADPAGDAAACAAIYAPYVLDSVISFEEQAPTEAEFRARIESYAATHAWLVAELDGAVVGYAYACTFNPRPVYRWSASVSVYVGADQRGRGVGRALYGELFDRLRRRGFRMACAGITLPNQASVALHESFGFHSVGVLREIGWKRGGWHDVGWWQLELAAAAEGAPAEPLPPG